ncbi:MAG: hypothetical protein ICV79_26660, partial [Flavisolibacter sp.]|nr:hypothetical protein [Flavisolibacter sp.]
MEIQKLLLLVPAKLLEDLAIETEVDYFAKKLQGEVIFKLLLHCMISHKDNSLRTMESAYETLCFRVLNSKHQQDKVRISSISERLSTITPLYFENLYQGCVRLYKKDMGAASSTIIRFDSTIVALSAKLLQTGYQLKGGDAEKLRQLKFTVGYADIPEIVHFYTSQSHSSEEVALKETILEQAKTEREHIKVFDRGIRARSTYDLFTDKGIQFISRGNVGAKHDYIKPATLAKLPVKTLTLTIVS